MRRLPWHVAVRADRKALMTAGAVALGAAFSIVGFALASGLEGETISEEGRFARPDRLLARADGTTFDARTIEGVELVVLLHDATDASGARVTLAGVEGPRAPKVRAGEARASSDVEGSRFDLVDPEATFERGPELDDAAFARAWLVVDAAALRALVGAPEGGATYVLSNATKLPDGLVAREAPAVQPFFRDSAIEVARDLALLVAFSSVLVGLFMYEFLRTEVRERRREIAIWRSVGMRVRDVAALLLARGVFISATGAGAGFILALGLLGVAAQFSGSGIFRGALSWRLALTLFGTFVLAGVAGALVPTIEAARRPVREWLEAAP